MDPTKHFIHDEFLLSNKTAQRLYHRYAEDRPIIDYHCHLPPEDIANNRQFYNLFEIWLEGDHYKWRAMRANGVAEKFCTGDAAPYDKFRAWAKTVPNTLRNPLYHWTHLELARYFNLYDLLDEDTCPGIWKQAGEYLETPDFRVHRLLEKFKVETICTTDDPIDDLRHHQVIAKSDLETTVFPTFRPDNALNVSNAKAFNAWTEKLAGAANVDIGKLDRFLLALSQRHQYFHDNGCRLSDHGLETCYAAPCTESEAAQIFEKARTGKAVSDEEQNKFGAFLMIYFGQLDAEKGWTKQLHLGAMRNVNRRRVAELGANTGFDTIGDWPQGRALQSYLDALEAENALPKMVLYNLNPADNYLFATMTGNFQDGATAGKIQYGSGWWFLDQKEAMEWQINALSNNGLLAHFVGMLTDSRSFMSFPRHEYFRRILCNILGREMESGEIPNDEELVGNLIKNICYKNARKFFGFQK